MSFPDLSQFLSVEAATPRKLAASLTVKYLSNPCCSFRWVKAYQTLSKIVIFYCCLKLHEPYQTLVGKTTGSLRAYCVYSVL